jgi:hypothetical protein
MLGWSWIRLQSQIRQSPVWRPGGLLPCRRSELTRAAVDAPCSFHHLAPHASSSSFTQPGRGVKQVPGG